MKTFLLAPLCFGVFLMSATDARAQNPAPVPKAVPVKQVPTPGRFALAVTSGDHAKSFTHPSKALTEISRALSRAKRAKEGEAPEFEAVFTLNDQAFTFTDPEAAMEACKAVTAAMRDLPKLRMGLGDLGEIPAVKPEDLPAANQPTTAKSPAAAMAEVRRRIQAALQKQMQGSGRGRPSPPNPLTIQRTIQQEIEKARNEGLLPNPMAGAANVGGGFAGGDPREARKEAIVQTLAMAMGRASSTGKAETAEQEEKTPEEKTETPKAEEKPEAPEEKTETPKAEEKPETPKEEAAAETSEEKANP